MVKLVRRRRVMRRRPLNKRRMMKRKGIGRATGKRTSDYAKVVEIQETPLIATGNAAGESVGAQMSWCLADFQRPQEVAHAYKYYRASKVEITFIPYYNVSQTQTGVGARLPQLYMSVDRVGNQWIALTETECLERGITPKVFNKKCKLSFKPNLLQIVDLEANQPSDGTGKGLGIDVLGAVNSIPLFNKWLPTQQSYGYKAPAGPDAQLNQTLMPKAVNPYALRYYGAIFNASIEGLVNSALAVGDIQLKVTWEFKGPRALKTNAPVAEPNPYVATSSQTNGVIPNTQPTTYP